MTYRNMELAWILAVLHLILGGAQSVMHSASAALQNPELSISRSEDALRLSWPEWASDWVLEQTAQVAPGMPWTTLAAGVNSLQVNTQLTSGFFRLRKLPITGLSGHWRFEEGSGDLAGGQAQNEPPIFFTNATWGTGRVGAKSLHFNGHSAGDTATRAWASNSNHALLPDAGPFSVSLWFSPAAMPIGRQGLIGHAGWSVALHTPSAGTNLLELASSNLTVTGQKLLLPNQWYELTVTHDGTAVCLYLDGDLLARQAGSLATDDGQIYLGGGVGGYNSFNGRIDEARTYTTALSREQVSVTGHWTFDDTVGTLAPDSSVRGHHAKAQNVAWVPGKSGNAVQLSSNEITIANEHFTVLPTTAAPFSLSLWLYPHSLPVGRSGLMSAADGAWELALDVTAPAQTAISFNSLTGAGTLDLRVPVPFSSGTWAKLDITYDHGIATVYLNGRKVHHDLGAIQMSRAPIRIGRVDGASNFDGLLDDLKIFRRARTASEIGPIATIMWETVFRDSATNITLQGSGPTGRPLTFSVLGTMVATNGTVTQLNGSPLITYAAGSRKGPDALQFTVSDGEFTSLPATLNLSVVQPHWLSRSGGSTQPLDGNAPARAWAATSPSALDAIWRTNNYYDCFFYAPGVYETTGWRYGTRPTAFPGCKHVGASSEGSLTSTIKLVNAWEAWGEGLIFGRSYPSEFIDGFEVHNLVLDCNAENNPKYSQGEPIWVRVPLTGTALVESITLHWNNRTVPSTGPVPWNLGGASEFRVCARTPGPGGYTTNCSTHVSTGAVDVVSLGVIADEILIHLDRRADRVDFYSIAEIEVAGAAVSLPSAMVQGGAESRLEPNNPAYSILRAIDKSFGTVWASGTETNVRIALPVDPTIPISALRLHWNCRTLAGNFLLGPAAAYNIKARRPVTGEYVEVPFTRQARSPDGAEDNTFHSAIQADQLVLELLAREPEVQAYSLREITLLNGGSVVELPFPSAMNTSPFFADPGIFQAFDSAPETAYVSFTQGMVGAVDVAGNNLKFTRLKVIGFGGKAGRECFPFYVLNPNTVPAIGNVLVEDCLFTDPATNNTEGITVLVATGKAGSLTNCLIRRCTVRDIRQHFRQGSHAFGANLIENCLVERCGEGVYFEPDGNGDDLGPVVIRGNRFIDVDNGVLVRFHPGYRFGPVTCTDNEIVLAPRLGQAFGTCDLCATGPSGSISNVVFSRNLIRYADWLPRPLNLEIGIHASDIPHALFVNNIVALGTKSDLRVRNCPLGWVPPPFVPQRCPPHPQDPPSNEQGYAPPCLDVLPAGYRRAWLNNRDLSGNLMPVRIWNSNVESLAVQQQPIADVP